MPWTCPPETSASRLAVTERVVVAQQIKVCLGHSRSPYFLRDLAERRIYARRIHVTCLLRNPIVSVRIPFVQDSVAGFGTPTAATKSWQRIHPNFHVAIPMSQMLALEDRRCSKTRQVGLTQLVSGQTLACCSPKKRLAALSTRIETHQRYIASVRAIPKIALHRSSSLSYDKSNKRMGVGL